MRPFSNSLYRCLICVLVINFSIKALCIFSIVFGEPFAELEDKLDVNSVSDLKRLLFMFVPRRDHLNVLARRYEGRLHTFETDFVYLSKIRLNLIDIGLLKIGLFDVLKYLKIN